MDAWWWVLTGLVAWLGVSLAVGLWLGPVFRHCSQIRKAMDAQARSKGLELPAFWT
jgi:hypothetical protein